MNRTTANGVAAIILAAAAIAAGLGWRHDDVQKHRWHDAYVRQTAAFSDHLREMAGRGMRGVGMKAPLPEDAAAPDE